MSVMISLLIAFGIGVMILGVVFLFFNFVKPLLKENSVREQGQGHLEIITLSERQEPAQHEVDSACNNTTVIEEAQGLIAETILQLQNVLAKIIVPENSTSLQITKEALASILNETLSLVKIKEQACKQLEMWWKLQECVTRISSQLGLFLPAVQRERNQIHEETSDPSNYITMICFERAIETSLLQSIEKLQQSLKSMFPSVKQVYDIQKLLERKDQLYFRKVKSCFESGTRNCSRNKDAIDSILNDLASQTLSLNENEADFKIVCKLLDDIADASIVQGKTLFTHKNFEIPFEDLNVSGGSLLGQGGFGVVLKGNWRNGNKIVPVAVKTLYATKSQLTTSLVAGFVAELKRWEQFEHPNIVQLLGTSFDKSSARLCFVMELMDKSLWDLLYTDKEEMDLQRVCCIAGAVCSGLSYLHENLIVHRDIKPQNILLKNGLQQVKLCDFGISTVKANQNTTTLLSGVNVCGTPAYMAPELLGSPPQYSSNSDIYSLGVLLAEMCESEQPFVGESIPNIVRLVLSGERPPLVRARSHFDSWLIELIEACWAADRSLRPKASHLVATFSMIQTDLSGPGHLPSAAAAASFSSFSPGCSNDHQPQISVALPIQFALDDLNNKDLNHYNVQC